MSGSNGQRDGSSGEPPFPPRVRRAGVAWIICGALLLINAMLNFAVLAAHPHLQKVPLSNCGAAIGTLAGIVLVVSGVQAIRGTTKDTFWEGVNSVVLGLVQPWLGACLVLTALLADRGQDDRPQDMLIACVGAVFSFAATLGLIAAGVLALKGRQDYLAWRRAREDQAAP
jgi:hypothetical protein